MKKKRIRDSLIIVVFTVLLAIPSYAIDENQIESRVSVKATEFGLMRVLETPNGNIILHENEDAYDYAYMMDLHNFSKSGYDNEEDLEKNTGYSANESKTEWFSISHYQEQEDGSYKKVEQDSCERLGFLLQNISIQPKEYEGYVYNEKISCPKITNGLPSSILFEVGENLFDNEEDFYVTDISFDVVLYYDLLK